MQKLREAAQMFVGRHDFRTFMTLNNDAHVRSKTNKISKFRIKLRLNFNILAQTILYRKELHLRFGQ